MPIRSPLPPPTPARSLTPPSSRTRGAAPAVEAALSAAVLVGLAALALSACADSHGAGTDAAPGDARRVPDGAATLCSPSLRAGDACAFAEPCRQISDFWMGYCGTETWSCIDGRVAYHDGRFRCSLDGGPPPGDAGPPPAWCDGYVAPPAATSAECRTSADCGGAGGSCWAPGDTTGLHAGGACPMDCDADGDCADGSVCVPLNGGSCHLCQPACTETSCGPWEACAASGHCEPAPCLDGSYTCPPGSSCGLAGTPADAHGCSLVPCASDADCGCGACVLGACAAGPGRCDLPRP